MRHYDGYRCAGILGSADRPCSFSDDDVNFKPHELGGKLRGPIAPPLRISILDGDVLSFYVASLAQRQPNSLGASGVSSCIGIS
jgi:hypothetical protein